MHQKPARSAARFLGPLGGWELRPLAPALAAATRWLHPLPLRRWLGAAAAAAVAASSIAKSAPAASIRAGAVTAAAAVAADERNRPRIDMPSPCVGRTPARAPASSSASS